MKVYMKKTKETKNARTHFGRVQHSRITKGCIFGQLVLPFKRVLVNETKPFVKPNSYRYYKPDPDCECAPYSRTPQHKTNKKKTHIDRRVFHL